MSVGKCAPGHHVHDKMLTNEKTHFPYRSFLSIIEKIFIDLFLIDLFQLEKINESCISKFCVKHCEAGVLIRNFFFFHLSRNYWCHFWGCFQAFS